MKVPRLKQYDVAIIGGGPAGSSTAYHTAKLGLKTIMFEKAQYPRDKPCGGALSSRCLQYLGEEAKKVINCDAKTMRLYSPKLAYFDETVKEGYFIIRSEFDHAMAKDAINAGATVLDGELVKDIVYDEKKSIFTVVSTNQKVKAKRIVIATGVQNNKLVKKLGIRRKWPKGYLAMTVVSETPIDNKILDKYGFKEGTLAIFFGIVPKGYGWCFVKKGYVNIGIGATWEDIRDQGAKTVYNNFVQMLRDNNYLPKDLELNNSKSHALAFKRPYKHTVFENLLVVGDCAGFVSPVTGEGLFYAIKSGEIAARIIHQNLTNGIDLQEYQKEWKKVFKDNLVTTGPFLQKTMYMSLGTMEFLVKLGIYDKKMSQYIADIIYGLEPYKRTLWRIMFRFPIALFKLVFHKKQA